MKTLHAPGQPAVITVGSLKFARSASALVDTLFAPGGTASGMFKLRKHSVLFRRPDGEAFACLIANPGQSKFFVTAFKLADGVTRYSYGLTDESKRLLGLESLTYSQQADEASRVWEVLNSL